MANRNFRHDLKSPDQGLVFIDGTITITGSTGATTADTLTYASASNVSTGLYRITLEDSYVSLKSCQLTVESTGSQGLIPQIFSSSVGSEKRVDFRLGHLTGSTAPHTFAVAKPSDASSKVHVSLVFKNSV